MPLSLGFTGQSSLLLAGASASFLYLIGSQPAHATCNPTQVPEQIYFCGLFEDEALPSNFGGPISLVSELEGGWFEGFITKPVGFDLYSPVLTFWDLPEEDGDYEFTLYDKNDDPVLSLLADPGGFYSGGSINALDGKASFFIAAEEATNQALYVSFQELFELDGVIISTITGGDYTVDEPQSPGGIINIKSGVALVPEPSAMFGLLGLALAIVLPRTARKLTS